MGGDGGEFGFETFGFGEGAGEVDDCSVAGEGYRGCWVRAWWCVGGVRVVCHGGGHAVCACADFGEGVGGVCCFPGRAGMLMLVMERFGGAGG